MGFFTGLSNQRQSNWVKAFPQTPTDSKSTGLRFVDKAGCNETQTPKTQISDLRPQASDSKKLDIETSDPENSVENSLQENSASNLLSGQRVWGLSFRDLRSEISGFEVSTSALFGV